VAPCWSRELPSRDEAKAAEARIEGWGRAQKQALVDGRWDLVRVLARGKHRHERT
jgi:putative endonuclease